MDIAERYQISQPTVAKWSVIGKNADKFILIENNHVPTDYNTLYTMADLDKTQVNQLCADGKPSRKRVKDFKIEVGLLEGPKEKEQCPDEFLEKLKLVPVTEGGGLSVIGKIGLQQMYLKIQDLFNTVPKPVQKTVMRILVQGL